MDDAKSSARGECTTLRRGSFMMGHSNVWAAAVPAQPKLSERLRDNFSFFLISWPDGKHSKHTHQGRRITFAQHGKAVSPVDASSSDMARRSPERWPCRPAASARSP